MSNRLILKIAGVVGVVATLASCSSSNKFASSIEKRRYNKGFYVDLGTKSHAVKATKTENSVARITPSNGTSISVKNVDGINTPNYEVTVNQPAINTVPAPTFRHSGNTSKPAVTKGEVKNNTNNPTVNASPLKSFITEFAANPPHGGGGSCKSWIVCLLLCWLLGSLGIHRFYMGYTWQGIVQLLTAGACGIWTLIDFIRIIMKSLKPKGGDYCD